MSRRGENDAIVTSALVTFASFSPRPRGFQNRGDLHWSLTGLEIFVRSVRVNENTVMDSAKDPEATSDAVISPSQALPCSLVSRIFLLRRAWE